MSAVRNAIGKLDEMIDAMSECTSLMEIALCNALKEIKDILEDETVLIIEWSEPDVQQVAREMIAYRNDVEEDSIIENPLTREQVIIVLEELEDHYDCNYGISWSDLRYAMDHIDLPSFDSCRKNNPEVWVLKRKIDGKYVRKDIYTSSLEFAEKFDSEEKAIANSIREVEYPVKIYPVEDLK